MSTSAASDGFVAKSVAAPAGSETFTAPWPDGRTANSYASSESAASDAAPSVAPLTTPTSEAVKPTTGVEKSTRSATLGSLMCCGVEDGSLLGELVVTLIAERAAVGAVAS